MQKALLSRLDGYEIRLCSSDDIPDVIKVNMLTLPEHYSDYFYHEILSDHPQTFIVAELDGKVVGYIMCRIEYGLSHLRRFGLARKGHIISVATLDEHRAKGVGSRMVQHALEEMRKGGCKEAYLEVRTSNDGAVKLYEKLGFKVANTLQSYYKDGEPAYLMALQLG